MSEVGLNCMKYFQKVSCHFTDLHFKSGSEIRLEEEIALFWISSAMNQSLSKISPTFSVSIFIVIASIYDSTDYYQRSLNFSLSYLELLQIFPSTQVIYLICCDKYILIFKAKYRALYLFVKSRF